MIQQPPKIYLDSNHLINISNIREGKKLSDKLQEAYQYINKCIQSGCCGIIFNPFAILEWLEGNATHKSANEIASVIDSTKLKYQLEADTFIYTKEVLDECLKKYPDIKTIELPPVLQVLNNNATFTSAIAVLATSIPDYLEKNDSERLRISGQIQTEIPVVSVKRWVMETIQWKQKNPDTCQEHIDGFNKALSDDIKGKDEYLKNPKLYQNNWIKRYLKIDKILEALNPGIKVDSILEQIDTKNCKAVALYWNVREKRMRSGNSPNDNDVDDYIFLPVVPYADIILTEKNLREFMLQTDKALASKVFSKATDAMEALKNLLSPVNTGEGSMQFC